MLKLGMTLQHFALSAGNLSKMLKGEAIFQLNIALTTGSFIEMQNEGRSDLR
jgi:hypothetical protein